MGNFHFDDYVERRNTNSLKYDFAVERGYPADVLPLWVADMDFPAPEPVLEALHHAVDHGIFGYSEVKDEYYRSVSHWFEKHFGWKTSSDWLVKTPGVVFALAMAVQALTETGDSVLIQPPVYYPFYSVVTDNERRLVKNELLYTDGHYAIDFDDFETKIREEHVKLFILCSPHNPVGRVWTVDELKRMGDICARYGVFVVSDEIHCDFSFPGHPHTMFAKACPEFLESTIICTSPGKSFNLAGLQVSNIWIPNPNVRKKFLKAMDRSGYSQLNTMGLVAARAAYESGEEWLSQCKEYLQGNLDYLRSFLREKLPEIKLTEPEGTYFAWLDCSGLGLNCKELNNLVIHKAKLWLDAGHIFGRNADRFQRVVLACNRRTLEQALVQLEQAVHS